jgi:hypothetical protein
MNAVADLVYRKKLVVSQIEALSRTEHGEIFKMLDRGKVPYSQNKNGCFFNISQIDVQLLEEIERFVSYCNSNRSHIDEYNKKLDECKLRGNLVKSLVADETTTTSGGDNNNATAGPKSNSPDDDDADADADDQDEGEGLIGGQNVDDEEDVECEDAVADIVPSIAPVPERKKTMTKFVVAKKRFAKRFTNEQRTEFTEDELLA